jgi:universal stress protein E
MFAWQKVTRVSAVLEMLSAGALNMAKQIRHILVAIRSLEHAPKNELHKAGALAKASGASVELFHVIDELDPGRSYPETATKEAVEERRAAIVARSQARLERFAQDKSLHGVVSVTCVATWDHPPYDAVVRRALATHTDLVIAATHGHRFGARLLLRNTDWELIRHCPVPLLLVKSRRPYQRPVVVAAVDPFHTHAKPADLDARLLGAASQLAELLHGTVHVFHAYMPLVTVDTLPVAAAPAVVLPPAVEEAHGQLITRSIDRLAERAGIPHTRCHIRMGDVAGELSALARRTRADLVVMGAVSRSVLARLFIGNTAENVLDKLSCDVLIVKPKGFTPKVARTSSLAKSGRPKHAAAPVPPSRREPDSTVTAARIVLPPLF